MSAASVICLVDTASTARDHGHMKSTAVFVCSKCDGQFNKWSGQCTECGAWGTVHEDGAAVANPSSGSRGKAKPAGKVGSFAALDQTLAVPIPTKLAWWDELLSGGLVNGSVTLLGGEPGIGKSTLTAQLAIQIARQNRPVLYVTGEESPMQVGARLKRLAGVALPETLSFLDETDALTIAATIRAQKPALTIVDSIQTVRMPDVTGEPGNPTQVKASAAIINEAAKDVGASVILVGQVNKDGDLAGPRLLEHLVDTVLMIEGDRGLSHRLLRVFKHRFGSADETAILDLSERGLEPILDPSAALLAHRPAKASGTIVTPIVEGNKTLLVELQALVTPAGYGTPLRRTSGIDANRASLLLAVMARRVGSSFGDQDVFANVIGGFSAAEAASDLAFCLAAISAKQDHIIDQTVAAFGEVGLAGELRPVSRMDLRVRELERLGFLTIILPKSAKLPKTTKAKLVPCSTVREACETLGLFKVR